MRRTGTLLALLSSLLLVPVEATASTVILTADFEDPADLDGWPVPEAHPDYPDPTWGCGQMNAGVFWKSEGANDGYGVIKTDYDPDENPDLFPDQNHCLFKSNGVRVNLPEVEVVADITFHNLPADTDGKEVTQGILLRIQNPNYRNKHYFFIEVVCPNGTGGPIRLQDQLVWPPDVFGGTGKEKMGSEPLQDRNSCVAGQHYTVRARIEDIGSNVLVQANLCIGVSECSLDTPLINDPWDPLDFPPGALPTTGGVGFQGASRPVDPPTNMTTYVHRVYHLQALIP